jgi:protein-disulfide isomerase
MKTSIAVLAATAASYAAVTPLVEGNPEGTVRVVIYEDLQCSDCAVFREMMDQQILPKYGGKVTFEHHDFPIPRHKWARQSAIAARYFATIDPKLALEWRRYSLAHLGEITAETFNDKLSAWANTRGLDPSKAVAALGDKDLAAAVEEDYQDGVARGIAHTPTVLVNGESFVETFTFEEISKGLERALSGQ